jgi:hypothetical protein
MRKTACPVVWEGDGAQSSSLDPIGGVRPTFGCGYAVLWGRPSFFVACQLTSVASQTTPAAQTAHGQCRDAILRVNRVVIYTPPLSNSLICRADISVSGRTCCTPTGGWDTTRRRSRARMKGPGGGLDTPESPYAVTNSNKKTVSRIRRRWAHLVQVALQNYLLPELSANNKRSFSSGLVVGDIIENRDPSEPASQDTRHGRRP